MENHGNISKESADAYDTSSPLKDSLREYKDSKTVSSPIDKENLQCKLDTGDSAASLKRLNVTCKAKEELGENAKLSKYLESTRNTKEPLQDYPVGTEDVEDAFDDIDAMTSTPRKNEVDVETLHNNSYSDDNSKHDSNETVRIYVDTNTLNLQDVVEALKTVASDVEDDSGTFLVPERGNVANSTTKSSMENPLEYLDPSAYIKDFSKTTNFLNLRNLMGKLLNTKEDKAVVRDMTKLYFENLSRFLWGYLSQIKREKNTENFDEKISLGHLKIAFDGFRDIWMSATEILDLKGNPKDTDEESEERSKPGTATSETISDPRESLYDNNTTETRVISMDLSSYSPTKKLDSEKEVRRGRISSCGDNTDLKQKKMTKEPTKTDGAEQNTISPYKTDADPENSIAFLKYVLGHFVHLLHLLPSNPNTPTNQTKNSIEELENFDDTKEFSTPSYTVECVADDIEKHEQTEDNNLLACSESECLVKKEESKKPNGNAVMTSSLHVHVNVSNEGLEVTDSNENTTACPGRGESYDDSIVEPKEFDDKMGKIKIEGSNQTRTSTEDIKKTERNDISPCSLSVETDLGDSIEVQKEADSIKKSSAVFDREGSYSEETIDELKQIGGTQTTTASFEEEDSDLQGSNEKQKKQNYTDSYPTSASVDSDVEVPVAAQKETDNTEKSIAVLDRRDSDPEESIEETKQIDSTEETVRSFDKEDFDPEKSNEEPMKTVDTAISPCSEIAGSDIEVSIEEQNETNASEKQNGSFNKEYSHPEQSFEEPTQVHTVETTVTGGYDNEISEHQESNEEPKKMVDAEIRSDQNRSDLKSNESIEDIKKSNDSKISGCRDRPDSDSKESDYELKHSEDNDMGLACSKRNKKSKEPDDSEGITSFGHADENPNESNEPLEVTEIKEKITSYYSGKIDSSDDLIVKPKKFVIIGTLIEGSSVIKHSEEPNKAEDINISPCTLTASSDFGGRRESDPEVSICEPKQIDGAEATATSLVEKDTDLQESNEVRKKTVDPHTYPCCVTAGSDLEISIVEQKEANSTEKPTEGSNKEDLSTEESNEKPKEVKNTAGTATSCDNEVSDNQECFQKPKKAVDPDTSCPKSSGSDLKVSIVEQKKADSTEKTTGDSNREDLSTEESNEKQNQIHGTEETPSRSDKEPKRTVDTDMFQHLDETDFNSRESIEEIKKSDITELSDCRDGPDSDSKASKNELPPLEDIEMSLACSEKVCSDMEEESKEPDDNVAMNNSDSTDANPKDSNEESDVKDMNENTSAFFGRAESSKHSVEDPKEVEGIMGTSTCKTEASSLIESSEETEKADDSDITTSSESADYGTRVSITRKNDDGLEISTAIVDSNPRHSVEDLKNIDGADEIIACSEDKNSSTKDSIEEPKEMSCTEIVGTISDSKVSEPQNSNEEPPNKTDDSQIKSVYIETIGLKINNLKEKAKNREESKSKETEESIKIATTEKISASSIDDIETVRDPKTPDNIENVSTCTENAHNQSERLVKNPSTSPNNLSRPSPVTDESLGKIDPLSVWDICDNAERQKLVNDIPAERRKVSSKCPESEENVDGATIPPASLDLDLIFIYDLYRLIMYRRKYPKFVFFAYPGSPLSTKMETDIMTMLFYKEREMYFVALQHKMSSMDMAEQSVSHFVKRRPFCAKTFLWLFVYICNHFALLEKVEESNFECPFTSIFGGCIFDLRKEGQFTDETWKDVEAAAKSIATSLRRSVSTDDTP